MPSKWKILTISGIGIMIGMVMTVDILGTQPEIIQESEVIPVGIFYNKNLELQSYGEFLKTMSWYDEVVKVSISTNDPQSVLSVNVESLDGGVIWKSEFVGSIQDSFIVEPGKGYQTSIKNRSDKDLIVDYGFETAYFEDKDGNFVITQHAKFMLILVGVGIGLTAIIIGAVNMKKIGEKTW